MKINFKLKGKEYQIKGGSHDFILSEYNGTKEIKVKGEKETVDNLKLIGYFWDPFRALSYLPNYIALNSDAKSFLELSNLYKTTLNELNLISKMFREVK